VHACKHNYTQYYDWLFRSIRHEVVRVFELGLGTKNPPLPSIMGVHGVPGASLRSWRGFRVYHRDGV